MTTGSHRPASRQYAVPGLASGIDHFDQVFDIHFLNQVLAISTGPEHGTISTADSGLVRGHVIGFSAI
jgi:hypothetical protein